MAKPVDPEKLVTFAQVADDYGYNADYLRQLARQNRIAAWLVGKTWITTREAIEAYIKSSQPAGRPPNKSRRRSSKN